MEEINTLTDQFDKQNAIRQLEAKTDLSVSSLVKDAAPVVTAPAPEKKKPSSKVNFTGVRIAEWTIINGMLYSRERCQEFKNRLNRLPQQVENRLAQAMVNYYIDHDTIDPEAFYASVSEEEKRVLDGIQKYDIINKEVFPLSGISVSPSPVIKPPPVARPSGWEA